MTEKRFVWDSTTRHGQIYDRITKKNLMGSKETLKTLNNLWDMVGRFEKHNQELIEENIRLQEKSDYCDNICQSYEEYYAMDIENAQWFGFRSDLDD